MMNNKKNIYVIDKPKKLSSNQVIQIIKKELKLRKIGHGGTLDPIATGVLIIGINNGTKHLNQNLNEDKTYLASIKFGFSTDTFDIEGKVTNESAIIPTLEQIQQNCEHFKNIDYLQTVPLYSAVKVNGQELYKYARSNLQDKIKELPTKLVKLIDYEIISFHDAILEIKLNVSKGFYIRSFVNDLALSTNSCATLIDLRRIKSGQYKIDDAYTIEEFIKFWKENDNTLN